MPFEDVLIVTLDSCRYDTFDASCTPGCLSSMSAIGPLYRAKSPSYFRFGSHSAVWMGFTPGVVSSGKPWLYPKA